MYQASSRVSSFIESATAVHGFVYKFPPATLFIMHGLSNTCPYIHLSIIWWGSMSGINPKQDIYGWYQELSGAYHS